jgi:hypothetical protein
MHKVFDEESTQGYKDSMKNIEDVWLSQLSETIASESVSDLNEQIVLYTRSVTRQ